MNWLLIIRKVYIVLSIVLFSILHTPLLFAQKNKKIASTNSREHFKPIDTTAIEKIIGIKGKSNNGEYKITIPQNDLDVEVDGFKIIPAMGLGTWVAFTPAQDGAMVMGDITACKRT